MSRTSESDDAFDDLLWELDVTSVRPRTPPPVHRPSPPTPPRKLTTTTAPPLPARDPRAVTPGAVVAEPRSVQPRAPRAVARSSRLGRREQPRFARPELHTLGERIAANRLVQAAGATLLLGGTSVLVVIALSRG